MEEARAYQRSTALRGLLTDLKSSAKYELQDIIEALPDDASDLSLLIRARVNNVLRKLDDVECELERILANH
jgi:hypothetical protein